MADSNFIDYRTFGFDLNTIKCANKPQILRTIKRKTLFQTIIRKHSEKYILTK